MAGHSQVKTFRDWNGQDDLDVLAALQEVRMEISRLNRAAGETVFNPSATQLLDLVIDGFGDKA